MQSLIPPAPAAPAPTAPAPQQARARSGPVAPSRLGFRMERLWLTPMFRILVSRIIPLLVLGLFAFAFMAQPDNMEQVRASVKTAKSQVAERPEYQVQTLNITGASPALMAEVQAAMGLEFPVSTLMLDLKQLQAAVAAVPAVAQAHVTLSDNRVLNVVAREILPAAILRKDNGQSVFVATDGAILRDVTTETGIPPLPLIAGGGAQAQVPQALKLFAELGHLGRDVHGMVRVGERRWDIVFDDGLTLSLPATDPMPAVHKFVLLTQSVRIFDGHIQRVDFRHQNRPTFRLNANGTARIHPASGPASGQDQ